jgi:DNA-binding transcriptional MocR family regulator
MIPRKKPDPKVATRLQLECAACGATADAACACGAPYLPAGERTAKAVADPANKNKSSRAIAAELGVSPDTVDRARKATARNQAVEKRVGLDGKARRLPLSSLRERHKAERKRIAREYREAVQAELADKQAAFEDEAEQLAADLLKHISPAESWNLGWRLSEHLGHLLGEDTPLKCALDRRLWAAWEAEQEAEAAQPGLFDLLDRKSRGHNPCRRWVQEAEMQAECEAGAKAREAEAKAREAEAKEVEA